MTCVGCGTSSYVQRVDICQRCLWSRRLADVTSKLAGPVEWSNLVDTVLYDEYGRAVARVRSVEIRHESIDVTPFSDCQLNTDGFTLTVGKTVPGSSRIRIDAEGIPE